VNFIIPWCGVGLVYFLNQTFPTSFNTLFLINIWLFSLPHTFSTFTRADRRSVKKVALTFSLLAIFMIAILTISNVSGVVFLYSIYFYWQQFHYGKQNLGLSRWKTDEAQINIDKGFYLSIVALSLIGLLGNGPQAFFGYVLYFPMTLIVSKLTIFSLMLGLTATYIFFRPKQVVHALEHTFIFSLAYLYCEHFALGWLLLNVFHNLQYLNFMKSYEAKFSFLLAPVLLTSMLFILQFQVIKGLIIFSLPLSLSLMIALNFTHYTLDGLIWKRSKQIR
jgi:hypothetical protein